MNLRNEGLASKDKGLTSLPEKASGLEADHPGSEMSDQSEDNTEDDVGEEVSNNLYSFKDNSLMSPTDKPTTVPKVHLQEIAELKEDVHHRNITAPAIQTPISSGSFVGQTKFKKANQHSQEKLRLNHTGRAEYRPT